MKFKSSNFPEVLPELVTPIAMEDEIIIDQSKDYTDYKLLNQQFEFRSDSRRREHELTFSFSNKSESIYLHQLKVVYYNRLREEWQPLPTQIKGREITTQLDRDVIREFPARIGFIINQFHYSQFTQQLANTFPLWTSIRRHKESTGQHFLNYFGIKIEELVGWINWVFGEKYISTADIFQQYEIYQYDIPPKYDGKEYTLHTEDGYEIESVEVREFFKPSSTFNYLVDKEKKWLFMKEDIKVFIIEGSDGELLEPKPYYLWNTFDEFGLLLDLPRRAGELNEDYKERLYDVFRYPSGSNRSGLQFAIAKELDILHKEVWEDDSKPYIIKRGREELNPHAIRVDYQPLLESEYSILDNGDVLLHPLIEYIDDEGTIGSKSKSRVVGYVNDVSAYEIFNEEDLNRLKNIYHWEDIFSMKFFALADKVEKISPITWGTASWDRSYWDTIAKSHAGMGFRPTYMDSNLLLWESQKIENERSR